MDLVIKKGIKTEAPIENRKSVMSLLKKELKTGKEYNGKDTHKRRDVLSKKYFSA